MVPVFDTVLRPLFPLEAPRQLVTVAQRMLGLSILYHGNHPPPPMESAKIGQYRTFPSNNRGVFDIFVDFEDTASQRETSRRNLAKKSAKSDDTIRPDKLHQSHVFKGPIHV